MILAYVIHALIAVAALFVLVASVRATSALSAFRTIRHSAGSKGSRERSGNAAMRDSFSEATPGSRKMARIRCNAVYPSVGVRFAVKGFSDCRSLNVFFRGNSSCVNGCLGLGTCAQACPVDAIVIKNGKIGVLERCNGCGLCVNSCPKSLIEIVARTEQGTYSCAAEKGEVTVDICPRANGGFWLNSAFLTESDFKRAGS